MATIASKRTISLVGAILCLVVVLVAAAAIGFSFLLFYPMYVSPPVLPSQPPPSLPLEELVIDLGVPLLLVCPAIVGLIAITAIKRHRSRPWRIAGRVGFVYVVAFGLYALIDSLSR